MRTFSALSFRTNSDSNLSTLEKMNDNDTITNTSILFYTVTQHGHLQHLKLANEIKHLTECLLLPGGHLVGPPLLGSSNSC